MSDIDNLRDLVVSTIVRVKKYDFSSDETLFNYTKGYLTCLEDLLVIINELKITN